MKDNDFSLASVLRRAIVWIGVFAILSGSWTNGHAQSTGSVAADPETSTPIQTAEAAPAKIEADDTPVSLQFSFTATPWRDVIRWLADESGLALHVGDLPPGTFTYMDSREYTEIEAINRINLFLVSEGFTVIRTGDLLSILNLSDPRSIQQLDVLAPRVAIEDLSSMPNDHDVVKCFFPLGSINADEAVEELAALNLMTTPTTLSRTNQVVVIDTVAKLRSVQQVLSAFEPDEMNNGTIVQSFMLSHVKAEDVLVVARPHLGLATGEMIGIDVSISSDPLGKNIFVTGVEDKVKLIERLVQQIDQPESAASDVTQMELKSHLVEGGNVDVVYNVLQTLLSGKTVRLSIDHNASSIVALASPDIQKEIAATVAQIQSSDAAFEVIPLENTDPFFVVTLLEQMLNLNVRPDPRSKLPVDPQAPKIDADPGNRRLFVRAKRHQIDQIKTIVEGLEKSARVSANTDETGEATFRILSIDSQQAEQLLETASTFWRDANPVIVYPSNDGSGADAIERVPGQPTDRNNLGKGDSQAKPSAAPTNPVRGPQEKSDQNRLAPRTLTSVSNQRAAAIRCQVTPRGVLLQSDDAEALDRFEQHLRIIAGPISVMPATPIVFYLQHTKPDDALKMLGELIDGGQSARQGEAGTLVNGYVSGASSGTFLSSMVASQDGTTTMMAGSITVVADARLNRLIAQGTPEDIEMIESYLKIIDKDNSITSIQTYGTTRVIELLHTNASEVAKSVREAFVGRVMQENKSSSKGGSSTLRSEDIDPREAFFARAAGIEVGGKKSSNEKDIKEPARDLEPKMTVAVHEPSNSLIVTAPETLLNEVETLVAKLDARGEQAVEVITPANSEVYGLLLQQLTGNETTPTRRSTSTSKTTPSRSSSSRSR